MKLSQLRHLVAVVEAGTVRQAAKNLHLSQSSVTKSVQQLEEDLKIELIRRSPHGVTATEAGRLLVSRAKVVEAELRHARSDIEGMRDANFGEIRLIASPTVAMGLLPRAVATFQHTRPRVSFSIQEGVYPDILPAVRIGEIDLAICLAPTELRDETLHCESLLADRVVPAVRADHPLIGMRNHALRDLLGLDWIIYRRGRTGLDVFEQTFRVNGLEPPRSTIECTSFACALALVESGNYATLLPSQLFSNHWKPLAIAPVPLDTPMPSWHTVVISRATHELSAVCRAFLAELQRTAKSVGMPHVPVRRLKAR
jgi:DNA-binding transcriptional LysR family regulator